MYERERTKVLLGATSYNTLVFAEIDFQDRPEGKQFTASFDEVRPVRVDDDYLTERAESYVERGSVDDSFLLDMLERYDCKYSELAEKYKEEQMGYGGIGVEGLLDISLYSESFRSKVDDDVDIYFESEGCGQHDCREDLLEGTPVSRVFIDWLHGIWDEFHLKTITPEQYQSMRNMVYGYCEKQTNKVGVDNDWETEWIKDWLEPEFGEVY